MKHERRWREMYEQLKEYRKRHGDCCVPQGMKPLGSWVMTQRAQYCRMIRCQPSSMTQERVLLLEDLGFRWAMQLGRRIPCRNGDRINRNTDFEKTQSSKGSTPTHILSSLTVKNREGATKRPFPQAVAGNKCKVTTLRSENACNAAQLLEEDDEHDGSDHRGQRERTSSVGKVSRIQFSGKMIASSENSRFKHMLPQQLEMTNHHVTMQKRMISRTPPTTQSYDVHRPDSNNGVALTCNPGLSQQRKTSGAIHDLEYELNNIIDDEVLEYLLNLNKRTVAAEET